MCCPIRWLRPVWTQASRSWARDRSATLIRLQSPCDCPCIARLSVAGNLLEAAGWTHSVSKPDVHDDVCNQVVRGALEQLKKAPGFDPDNVYFWPSITQRAYQVPMLDDLQPLTVSARFFLDLDPLQRQCIAGVTSALIRTKTCDWHLSARSQYSCRVWSSGLKRV